MTLVIINLGMGFLSCFISFIQNILLTVFHIVYDPIHGNETEIH